MRRFKVATDNPLKVEAVRRALRRLGISARVTPAPPPKTAPQPVGWAQTLALAKRRARACGGIGIEAGLVRLGGVWLNVHVCAVYHRGRFAIGLGPAFEIPRVPRKGDTLADIFGHAKNGAIGVLSGGRVRRLELLEAAVLMALLRGPFHLRG